MTLFRLVMIAQLLIFSTSFSPALVPRKLHLQPLQIATTSRSSTRSIHAVYDVYESFSAFLDLELKDLSQESDDEKRRTSFKHFIIEQVEDEQQIMSGIWSRRTSPFVLQLNQQLSVLGQSVQNDAWEEHVVSGFQTPAAAGTVQLWACVDMMVQFKTFIRKLEQEINASSNLHHHH